MRSSPSTIVREALAAGWQPEPINDQKVLRCTGGCGRSLVHDLRDRTLGYTCPICAESAVAWLRAQRRRENAVKPSAPVRSPASVKVKPGGRPSRKPTRQRGTSGVLAEGGGPAA